MTEIVDLAEMPEHNQKTGTRGLHSVTEGKVYWLSDKKAVCVKHGAMNCVSEDRRIWRCVHAYTCGEGCYVREF